MGTAFGDYDNDGDQDLYLTNSHEVPSRLYRNDGVNLLTGVPEFTDVGAEVGVAAIGEPARGFGACWGDYDNDGFLDLLFAREENSRLWHNDGPDGEGGWSFTEVTGQGGLDISGVRASRTATSATWTTTAGSTSCWATAATTATVST